MNIHYDCTRIASLSAEFECTENRAFRNGHLFTGTGLAEEIEAERAKRQSALDLLVQAEEEKLIERQMIKEQKKEKIESAKTKAQK